ncbi:MAG: hypothetical protein IKD50_04745, partial [Clostridia bacterium]|nr:hypothetical protein [Clostridia bacterium]
AAGKLLQDVELHKKYIFITYLLSYLNIASGGSGFDLTGKIKASNFIQRKGETYTKETQVSRPVMKLPQSDGFHLTEQKLERLSQIIADINSRTGKAYDSDVAVKAMLQIRDILLKSDKLKTSARTNSVSFREDTKKLQDCVGLINRDWHKSMRPFWGVFYYLFRLSFPVY